MKLLNVLVLVLLSFSTLAERSPFTNIVFGEFPGRGEYIEVENDAFLDGTTSNIVLAINGINTQEIFAFAKQQYGTDYKCKITEHFTETLEAMGHVIGETVSLRVYQRDQGHRTFNVDDVAVTEDNNLELVFNTSFCL